MKKLILLLLSVLTLSGCSVSNELAGAYNMTQCKYSYQSISDVTISDMNLSNGLTAANILRIGTLLSGNSKSIPMNFTINLDVKNPNKINAMLHGMEYSVNIDGIEFTTGSINQPINIRAGANQVLPLTVGVDLVSLMSNHSHDAVSNMTKNFVGAGERKSNITLKLRPTFMVGVVPVSSPVAIPLSFSFGGK